MAVKDHALLLYYIDLAVTCLSIQDIPAVMHLLSIVYRPDEHYNLASLLATSLRIYT